MTVSRKARTLLLAAIPLLAAFTAVTVAGIATWEYTNSDAFCARACHGVHPEEPYAHRFSQHAQVRCVECHMGRLSTFEMMASKVTHSAELWAMITGYERPLLSHSMPASRHSCEGCHSLQPHQHDSIRVRKHYASDEANTETRIQLTLRTAGGAVREEGGRGIHWHTTDTRVRFVATDPQKQDIPWVQVEWPDGRIETYTDTSQPLSESQIATSEKRVMDCMDCHNRVGHPFRNPEEVLDHAFAEGKLKRHFPFVKARASEVLRQDFETKEEAVRLVEEAWDQYVLDFPYLPKQHPEEFAESRRFMRERQEFLANLMVRGQFLEPGVSWRSFLDNSGHKDSPGCFRCHSGSHVNAEGKPIPANCTLCHQVPIVVREDETPPGALTPVGAQPASHQQADFLSQHFFLLDESCETCHAEISYGSENDSFCSNRACHGFAWPNLTLVAR